MTTAIYLELEPTPATLFRFKELEGGLKTERPRISKISSVLKASSMNTYFGYSG